MSPSSDQEHQLAFEVGRDRLRQHQDRFNAPLDPKRNRRAWLVLRIALWLKFWYAPATLRAHLEDLSKLQALSGARDESLPLQDPVELGLLKPSKNKAAPALSSAAWGI